jgi:hypothetical protein
VKTEQLIRALSADRTAPPAPIGRDIGIALLAGLVLAALMFMTLLNVRADAASAMGEWRFALKFVVTLGLAVPAIALLRHLATPFDAAGRAWLWLLLAPIGLLCGILAELVSMPADTWSQRLIGTNALHCLSLIPLLSLPLLACVFVALKRGAPAHPRRAGAIGGVACASVAAALYALNCPDDSPLFVATWYVIAIATITAGASVLGSRVLRW